MNNAKVMVCYMQFHTALHGSYPMQDRREKRGTHYSILWRLYKCLCSVYKNKSCFEAIIVNRLLFNCIKCKNKMIV